MGRAMFPPSSLTWSQTMVEVMEIMAHPSTGPVHTLPHSVPPTLLTHASTRDFWTLTGILESVSFGVTAPFSWVLVHTRFCLFSSRISPVLCKFRRLYDGVNGVLQEGLCHIQGCCPKAPAPAAAHCWPIPPQETPKHSSVSVSAESLGPGAHKVCLSPPGVSGGYGVWF